ncbi:hypothetical protein J6590_036003 [Homalodisca vitripennis]|nr:hypothetical protein J6590_036003 [Homalodisca vitripennis]
MTTTQIRDQRFKGDLRTTATVGYSGRLEGQDRSAVTHPSSSRARRGLIRLSSYDRRTRSTVPLYVQTIKSEET